MKKKVQDFSLKCHFPFPTKNNMILVLITSNNIIYKDILNNNNILIKIFKNNDFKTINLNDRMNYTNKIYNI